MNTPKDSHSGLQGQACRVLQTIAKNNDDCRMKIGEAGGIELVMAAMRGHAGSV
eukprot:CAMPEP_0180227620 /NCGR_PEP_ID=MMETSP0987-20121128/24238_1 /TAXON_ID=697907 /ORGANISM="non described non described, Strain CCMP2293" /LENGTH=53 /DNA_ID=CAMNT_0022191581 /DNA_START=147 /DNA_END=304 /DNA_ORIENTATION=-